MYGMLGTALMLFFLRGLCGQLVWDTHALKMSFWCLNIGLSMMAVFTLLPLGILQLLAVLEHGCAYARFGPVDATADREAADLDGGAGRYYL
jgi:nitric oxide reductase subunit B